MRELSISDVDICRSGKRILEINRSGMNILSISQLQNGESSHLLVTKLILALHSVTLSKHLLPSGAHFEEYSIKSCIYWMESVEFE